MLSCDYPGCTAQYRRKEHLNRHARKHCAPPQLACEHCNKTFERSDTLRRHQQLHLRQDNDATPRAAKACDHCHSSKTRCDGKQPCKVCSRRGLRCTFNRQSKRGSKAATAAEIPTEAPVSEFDTPESLNSLPMVDTDITTAVSAPDRDTAIKSIIRQHEQELRQNRTLLRPDASGAYGSPQHSSDDSAQTPLDIDYHVEVYFAHFHSQWPFLHKPSFLRTKSSGPQVLLLTVVMIGLWVTGDVSSRSRAEKMHDKLVALLENRVGDWKSQKEFKDKLWPISTFQAVLLNIIFSLMREVSIDLHERCASMLRALTTTCIAGGLFSYERMRAQIHSEDSLLFSWTYVEETQRLALALFKVNSFFQTGMLSVSDLEFPLPENGYLWDAPETKEFYSRYHAQLESGAYAHEPPLICDIFQEIGRGGRGIGLLLQMDIYGQLETLRGILCQLDPSKSLPPDLLQDIDSVITHRNVHSLLTQSGSIPPCITISHANNQQTRISLWKGDITTLTEVTAIVNAANPQMLGCFRPSHRCIDNVIHSAAGPRLREACYEVMQEQGHEEPSGRAKVTPGFNLHAQYVIHTVGPQLDRGRLPDDEDRKLLRECYVCCLEAAESLPALEDGRKVVVFCCISTGIFAFPSDVAARIALETVYEWCLQHPETTITDIIFDTFLQRDWDLYNQNIASLAMAETADYTVTKAPSPPEPPRPLISPAILKAQSWFKGANYLIISAGAGLSAATGLDYTSPDLFAKHFPAFLPLGLRRLYDVFGYDGWESPCQKWGYYFTHLNIVRTWPLSPLYVSLRKMADRFGTRCFIRTSNADGLFVANGFDALRISTPQGQYAFLQCFDKCRAEAVFASAPFIDAALPVLDPVTQCLTDSSKIPTCEYCGGELTLCVRGGDYFNSSLFRAQEREYKRFIQQVSNEIAVSSESNNGEAGPKAVILELGVGMNTPSVLRWANEELVEDSPESGFRLIRAGLDAAGCAPWGLEEEGLAVGISGNINAVVDMLIGISS
ncbi:hypothetical protein BJY01DRAFT_236795 [Aspergillus pseudoustus]|uniref:ADP-ribose 1''-phosphate phosphatase n=1 Tax=Aspergillus pseudoustus TaxID=1810923 RepID=A0ABR4JJT1_9EURO